jgi:hypothetical protein
MSPMKLVLAATATMIISCLPSSAQDIQHDAEHYVLLHQYGDQWAAEDIDKQLAEIRERNGGKPPNIVYILVDDMGFGDFGMPELNKIRGGRTPNLDKFAKEE